LKVESKTWFNPEQRNLLTDMFNNLTKSFELMNSNLSGEYNKAELDAAAQLKSELRSLSNTIRKKHLQSIEKGDYNVRSGLIYTELFTACEQLTNHLGNVSDSIAGKV